MKCGCRVYNSHGLNSQSTGKTVASLPAQVILQTADPAIHGSVPAWGQRTQAGSASSPVAAETPPASGPVPPSLTPRLSGILRPHFHPGHPLGARQTGPVAPCCVSRLSADDALNAGQLHLPALPDLTSPGKQPTMAGGRIILAAVRSRHKYRLAAACIVYPGQLC